MVGSNAPCQLSLPVCTWNKESEWKEQEYRICPGRKGYLLFWKEEGLFEKEVNLRHNREREEWGENRNRKKVRVGTVHKAGSKILT
jgi:hypothetical protein